MSEVELDPKPPYYPDVEPALRRLDERSLRERVLPVIEADGIVHPSELEFMQAAIPSEELERRGLFDGGEPSEKFSRALQASLVVLPGMLTRSDKLMLTQLLMLAADADGETVQVEAEIVLRALGLMGIERDEFVALVHELQARATSRG